MHTRETSTQRSFLCGARMHSGSASTAVSAGGILRGQTQALSEGLKIPLQHLRWYAAFHNEGNHPHVHLIAYGANPREGYLSKQGVNRLRSSLARDIFAQELLCIYEEQTQRRDGLKQTAAELVQSDENPRIEALLASTASRLPRLRAKSSTPICPRRKSGWWMQLWMRFQGCAYCGVV